MIRKFEILNEKFNNELNGYLYYDTEKDKYKMKLLKSYKGKHPEIFFRVLNEQGVVDVPDYLVNNWVQGRVIPPNRQGLRGILDEIGMKEYNVFDLLIYCNGRCHMDSLCIREIKD